MFKQNSKEIARVDNDVNGRVFIDCLRLALNTARYKVKVRGRKPDKIKMKEEGLPKYHYSRDGDIPRKHATELAIYLDGVTHECDTCAVIKENRGLRVRLAETRCKLDKANAEAGQQAETILYLGRLWFWRRTDKKILQNRLDKTKNRAEYWSERWDGATVQIRQLNERLLSAAEDRDTVRTLKEELYNAKNRIKAWSIKWEALKSMAQRQKCFLAMFYYFRD